MKRHTTHRRASWLTALLCGGVLHSCSAPPPAATLTLTPTRAARSETVTATLGGVSAAGAQVYVGALPASVQSASADTVVFSVPAEARGGPQPVRVVLGAQTLAGPLGVLGDVARHEVVVLVRAGVSQADFQARLTTLNLGLGLLDFDPLGGPGPCAASIARVSVPGAQPVGFVLDRLSEPAQADVVLQADPQSIWDLDVDHLGAIGAPAAHTRGLGGAGVTIAVLDTGVSPQAQLGADLLPGYDFIDEDQSPADPFDDPGTPMPNDGHGTPVAVLAAGSISGVAPSAKVLPVRVGDATGQMLGSHAIRGVCYALANADNAKLVLNLSFGGDTPVEALRTVLNYALGQNVLIAAAAGNQGAGGPTHYPAAFDLPGLIAVGALQQVGAAWVPATFSTRGAYLDIAAPGQAVSSGNPADTFSTYDGTSFATPLVAGALALWREANPGATPAQIEQDMKASVQAVPGASQTAVGSGLLNLTVKP